MPRKPRIEVEGLLYHIIARGIEKRKLFKEKEDYYFFLEHLENVLISTRIQCYAFCLMPNHFHLLLKQESIPISTAMRRLLTRYALYFNKKHNRAGHLFQNRYKSIICQEDSYLLELIRYIHLNPARAKMVSTVEELASYPFSSHTALITKGAYNWYPKEEVLSFFGRTGKRALPTYLDFIADGLLMGKEPKYSGGGLKRSLGYPEEYPKERYAFDERILGESDFVLSLQQIEEKNTIHSSNMTIDELILEVAKEHYLDPEEIRGRSKKKLVCDARIEIAYIASNKLGFSYAHIARQLDLNRSTVARMVERKTRCDYITDLDSA